jgi:hypothetical protein
MIKSKKSESVYQLQPKGAYIVMGLSIATVFPQEVCDSNEKFLTPQV